MDSQTANKVEYILSGYGVLPEDFNELIELMDSYKEQESKAENLPISGVVVSSFNICTDTGEECKYNCSGLCKERC